MKLSRSVLAALLALPLAGAALATDEPAGQAGIERRPLGAEALPAEVAPPMPGDVPAAPDASPGVAAGMPADPSTSRAAGADADPAADDAALQKAEVKDSGDADQRKDAGSGNDAAAAEKDGRDAAGGDALGEKQAVPAHDDDPALDRAREPVAAPPAPAQEEPASSRI